MARRYAWQLIAQLQQGLLRRGQNVNPIGAAALRLEERLSVHPLAVHARRRLQVGRVGDEVGDPAGVRGERGAVDVHPPGALELEPRPVRAVPDRAPVCAHRRGVAVAVREHDLVGSERQDEHAAAVAAAALRLVVRPVRSVPIRRAVVHKSEEEVAQPAERRRLLPPGVYPHFGPRTLRAVDDQPREEAVEALPREPPDYRLVPEVVDQRECCFRGRSLGRDLDVAPYGSQGERLLQRRRGPAQAPLDRAQFDVVRPQHDLAAVASLDRQFDVVDDQRQVVHDLPQVPRLPVGLGVLIIRRSGRGVMTRPRVIAGARRVGGRSIFAFRSVTRF